MKLALHACCGPCLLEPYDALSAEHEVLVVYANPNIHPVEEYERRRNTLLAYARERGVAVAEVPYEPAVWEEAVAGLVDSPDKRCRACFRLRIGLAARHAAGCGFEAVATTLTVSPFQDLDAIREAGGQACTGTGVAFLETDFRDRYPEAVRRSRELGMYRQDFCGCRYSESEAAEARKRRRARKAQTTAGEKGDALPG